MTQVLVVSHGDFAAGLIDAATMIMGPQEGLAALRLDPSEDPATLSERVAAALEPDAPALVLVDLFGASPANAAAALLRDRDLEIVSGVNLPMLVEVLAARLGSPQGLAEVAVRAGREGVRDVGAQIRNALARAREAKA